MYCQLFEKGLSCRFFMNGLHYKNNNHIGASTGFYISYFEISVMYRIRELGVCGLKYCPVCELIGHDFLEFELSILREYDVC